MMNSTISIQKERESFTNLITGFIYKRELSELDSATKLALIDRSYNATLGSIETDSKVFSEWRSEIKEAAYSLNLLKAQTLLEKILSFSFESALYDDGVIV